MRSGTILRRLVSTISALFAPFLDYNPMEMLLSPTTLSNLQFPTLLSPATLSNLPAAVSSNLTGTSFFPGVIGTPFVDAMHLVFWLSAGLVFLAAIFSYLRGGRFVYDELDAPMVVFNAGGPESAPVRVPVQGGAGVGMRRQ